MTYKILYDNPSENIYTRLLKVRNIEDDIENFLNPNFLNYWIDPYLLKDLDKAVERIIKAIQNNEKIIIFGDYDVDGITASFVLYSFFTKFLKYPNISIRLPNRLEDGYGIKSYHLDEIKSKGVSLVITVDNGITAVNEAIHAKNIGLDLIVTDHHKQLDIIPDAFAVVNPQTSPDYPFKGICGAGVAFKLVSALSTRLIKDQNTKKDIINYIMPIVTIGTVADCVPLVSENRLFVKMGLDIINKRQGIPKSIENFLEYLNIKGKLDTYHIGFMIAPRLNAGGRIMTPYDSLYCLIYSDFTKQVQYLDKIEQLNTDRRKMQEEMTKNAEEMIDKEKSILIATSEEFHEGIIGIVAGRLTEKYNKPSIVMAIDKEKGHGVASLRGPEYFSVIDMLYNNGDILERFGGHKQAGGLTIKIENIEKFKEKIYEYCEKNIDQTAVSKTTYVDTYIYGWELENNAVEQIEKFGPYGEGNKEPIFMIEELIIESTEKVGKNGSGHLKAYANKSGIKFPIMMWGKGGEIDNIKRNTLQKAVGKIKKDDFKGGFYMDGIEILDY